MALSDMQYNYDYVALQCRYSHRIYETFIVPTLTLFIKAFWTINNYVQNCKLFQLNIDIKSDVKIFSYSVTNISVWLKYSIYINFMRTTNIESITLSSFVYTTIYFLLDFVIILYVRSAEFILI